jgi:hypothetical protein
MKISLVGHVLFPTDGQTDRHDEAFRNFANAPEKEEDRHSDAANLILTLMYSWQTRSRFYTSDLQ